MKRISPAWTGFAMAVLVPAWFLAVPATAVSAQARGRSHTSGGRSAQGGGGTAVPRGERSGSAGTRSGGGATSSTGRGAVERGPKGTTSETDIDKGATGGHAVKRNDPAARSPESGAVPAHSRPRDGHTAVGQAVPRSSVPPARGGAIVVPGGYYSGYYPWGFGGLGLGGYYGGYYDPYGGYYDPYGGYQRYPRSSYTLGYEGALRLKVKPRDAPVYVDGYYVGLVDDFDGVFQRLHIEAGPHRIEISAPGYEPLTFDVRIEPDQTLTYHGELTRLP